MHRTWLVLVGVLALALGMFVSQQVYRASHFKAAPNAASSLPGLIPPGMRALSVWVNEAVAVAGFVVPGTRADVLLTGTPSGNNEQQTTVLENVAVIATGQGWNATLRESRRACP